MIDPTDQPTGDGVAVCVSFAWSHAGSLTLDPSRKLAFPPVPLEPGIYRLTLLSTKGVNPAVYIGQSDNLRRRMRNYQNPGPTQKTSQRINRRLLDHLAEAGTVLLDVATAVRLEVTGDALPADLTPKPHRLLAESAAWSECVVTGAGTIENLE